MSVQCAHDDDGHLKDASEIEFYNSESDEKALPAVSNEGPIRRSTRKRQTDKLTAILAAEHADEDGNPQTKHVPRVGAPRAPRVKTVPETPSEEDDDFEMPDLRAASDSEDSDSEDEDVDNDEIADLLSSKTVPAHGGATSLKPQTRQKSSAGKRKQSDDSASAPPAKKVARVTIDEVEDDDDTPKTTFKNPIYLFFDVVKTNSEGSTGKPGDKHYKCRHGKGRIITVTKAMRCNIGGLTSHLKKEFPVMYRLYCALHTRKDELE
ncbi:hypothetical protein C8R44DRAFT_992262 [Mycena epipterygia]|nr:hypothetical protein C8R44DRAFT_992262 [Mycena epipterygia]